ncbi:general negative regulator of transcription subunit 5 [Coemansia sp. Benny D115]|nr:general negative regulator of transcription subunit 5 [Coemansia sp. Benny D115]
MSRKVQAEIERVFKRVAEGIEEFEDCYDKVLNASNASQKDKYETDLKKEIKKLQRLRDQIKTWIQSNDIKDKQDLVHHRKLIEKQMEKFKAIEKEMKTKAYSKEGLLQSTKLDPKEKEKLDLCNWLVESVDTLSTQIDVFESTAETIESSMSKKRRDANKAEKLSRLHERVERHKHHIWCLERIQRLLENENLSTEQVQRIQEDVNYYVEQNDEEDFVEDEFIYDELPLKDDDALFAIPGDDDAGHNDSRSASDNEGDGDDGDGSLEGSDVDDSVDGREAQSQLSASEPLSAGKSSTHGGNKSGSTTRPTTSNSATIVVPQPSTLQPAPVESRNAWSEKKESVLSPSRPGTTTGFSQGPSILAPPPPTSSTLAQPWAAIASQNVVASSAPHTAQRQGPLSLVGNSTVFPRSQASATSPVVSKEPSNTAAHEAAATTGSGPGLVSTPAPVSGSATPSTLAATSASDSAKASKKSGQASSLTAKAAESQAPGGAKPSMDAGAAASRGSPRPSTSPVGTKRTSVDDQPRASMQRPKYFSLFQDAEVPDAFADLMATFMKAKHQFSAKTEAVYNAQRQMVDFSMQGLPSLLDQERPKQQPQSPVNTPAYYPQTALPVIEHPGMASHLDLDTLFFAFYYQPNTYQQYLAAKELNRQSWRFHKKYLTWFQRYEEPSDITDDYEQGTYIYFDYEGAWCQRKKSEFRFEYQYLEDTELA